MGDLTVFEFFRQESSHADIIVRTEAMNNILYILVLLEPEQVKSEVIPYLLSAMTGFVAKSKEEDQVLLALASNLGYFIKFIGGPEYAPLLIPTFEYLCSTEETTVRNATVSSLNKVLAQLVAPPASIHKPQIQEFFDLFRRLSNDENVDAFYSRISSCHIVGEVYRVLDTSDRAVVREVYQKLVNDEISLVKRAAGHNLLSLATHAEPDILSNDLFQILKKMVVDDLATVRVIGVDSFIPFVRLLKKAGNVRLLSSDIISIVRACYEDTSWKIRLAISKEYESLPDCLEASAVSSDVFPGLVVLLSDVEPDIRRNAVRGLPQFLPVVGSSVFLNDLLPLIPSLLTDPMPDVRKAFAEACVLIAVKLPLELANNHICDVIMKLMNDEDPLVKLRIVQKVPLIAEEIPSLCTRLTEMLRNCLLDANWRIRKGIVLVLPALLKIMGTEYFTENFLTLFLTLLKDSVGEVRHASAEAVPLMISYTPSKQGSGSGTGTSQADSADFVYNRIFPTIKSMGSGEHMVRLNMLTVLDGLVSIRDLLENFRTEAVQLLVFAANDKVANIRLRAAQVMATVGRCAYPENVKGYIKSILTNLQNDVDKDVRYFTSEALKEFP